MTKLLTLAQDQVKFNGRTVSDDELNEIFRKFDYFNPNEEWFIFSTGDNPFGVEEFGVGVDDDVAVPVEGGMAKITAQWFVDLHNTHLLKLKTAIDERDQELEEFQRAYKNAMEAVLRLNDLVKALWDKAQAEVEIELDAEAVKRLLGDELYNQLLTSHSSTSTESAKREV